MSAAAIDSLGFHLAIIGLGVFIGYLTHGGLVRVELLVRPPSTDGRAFFDTSPLFPLCMNGWLGGPSKPRIAGAQSPKRAISFQDTTYGYLTPGRPKSRNIAVLSPHPPVIGPHAPPDRAVVIIGFADRGSGLPG